MLCFDVRSYFWIVKKTVGFFLFCLLTLQIFLIPALTMSFKLNQNYIASNLCENKNKPALQCNGKCFLKKQIASADTDEQNAPKKLWVKFLPEFLSLADNPVEKNFPSAEIVLNGDASFIAAANSSAIFHPPKK